MSQQYSFRYFYKVDSKGLPIPGALVKRKTMPPPSSGIWIEVTGYCCAPTTTTTETTSTTTTTTTTAAP